MQWLKEKDIYIYIYIYIYTDNCPSLDHSPGLLKKSLFTEINIKINIKAELFKIIFKIFELIFVAFFKKQIISTHSYNFSSDPIIFATR